MALGIGDGAALRQPLAIAVIGGLGLSTLLTLVVIPCAYAMFPGGVREAWRARARSEDTDPDGQHAEVSRPAPEIPKPEDQGPDDESGTAPE